MKPQKILKWCQNINYRIIDQSTRYKTLIIYTIKTFTNIIHTHTFKIFTEKCNFHTGNKKYAIKGFINFIENDRELLVVHFN